MCAIYSQLNFDILQYSSHNLVANYISLCYSNAGVYIVYFENSPTLTPPSIFPPGGHRCGFLEFLTILYPAFYAIFHFFPTFSYWIFLSSLSPHTIVCCIISISAQKCTFVWKNWFSTFNFNLAHFSKKSVPAFY